MHYIASPMVALSSRRGRNCTATQKVGRPNLGRRWLSLTAFSRMAAVSASTLRARSRGMPTFRNMLSVVEAVPVRIRERSSLKTVSLTQKSRFSIAHRPRHSFSSVDASACSRDRLVTAWDTDRVTSPSVEVLLSSRRNCWRPGHFEASVPTVVEVSLRTSKRPRFFSLVATVSRAA